jgi:diadenosine tetraphosphate (Ap4A) HIT family hydrolase
MLDKIVYETKDFEVISPLKPHVARSEGGHLKVAPKTRYPDRLELSPDLAVEMAWLTMLAGEAMTNGLRKRGIDIGLINYQDNKNWSALNAEGPWLHIQLYGRAKSAKINKYGEVCEFPRPETGYYDAFEPLNDGDIKVIQAEIKSLLKTDKYQKANWILPKDI